MILLKAKKGLAGLKMKETKNACYSKIEGHENVDLTHIVSVLSTLSFLGQQGLS